MTHADQLLDDLGLTPAPEKRQPRNGRPSTRPFLSDEFPQTDEGNAQRFLAMHGDDVLYCHPWGKWLAWDGTRYRVDESAAVERLAKESLATIGDSTWRMKSQAARRLSDCLRLARVDRPVLPDGLDVDPWLLNVKNGVVDLRDGRLHPHDRSRAMTKLAPVEFLSRSEAECPRWEDFVEQVTAGDSELASFLRRACGYTLTGAVSEHALFFCHGPGANGKSVFLSTLQALLGPDYSAKAPADLLLAKRGDAHPTERALLFGRRLVLCTESDDGRRFAEALLKELTGGDRISARRMREDFWDFAPTHKLWLSSNHKPAVRGTDHGIWRRIRLIPFSVTIPEERQDKSLGAKLLAELPGILHWAVQGCLQWQAEGLGEPKAVLAATAAYRCEMDLLGSFMAECCIVGDGRQVHAKDFRAAYENWCQQQGERPISQRRLGAALSERGFAKRHSNGTWYIGLGLADLER